MVFGNSGLRHTKESEGTRGRGERGERDEEERRKVGGREREGGSMKGRVNYLKRGRKEKTI